VAPLASLDQKLIPDPRPERWLIDGAIRPVPVTGAYTDIFQMLQGSVAGVWVTGTFNHYQIRIRQAPAPPLVVLDGIRLIGYSDQEINDLLMSIPPSTVESIGIVKNVADAAMYGPVGGNGVILLRTLPGAEW
jgi:outer membrane receptor protein involved in Fe transport